jgi:hypothetical protein
MDPTQLAAKLPYPDHSKGPELLQTLWILGSISIVVVALRIYAKIQKTRRLYWDDGLMVLALVRIDQDSTEIPTLAKHKCRRLELYTQQTPQ